jgi:hypothetical protein
MTKDIIWIIGTQTRSLENIPSETLFVTKPYESSPPRYRLVVMTWILALEANCNQIRPYMEIYNIIK